MLDVLNHFLPRCLLIPAPCLALCRCAVWAQPLGAHAADARHAAPEHRSLPFWQGRGAACCCSFLCLCFQTMAGQPGLGAPLQRARDAF
jgi:hypothetical protein